MAAAMTLSTPGRRPLDRRPALHDAAQQLIEAQTGRARRGMGMAQAALAGAHVFRPLQHYPAGDVRDAHGAGQFYYHAHTRQQDSAGEHGHFHLFCNRRPQAPARHLVALSLDARGWPLRWFCTNRWVTGGPWTHAADTLTALRRFRPVARGRLAPVARWLAALVQVYEADLGLLLQARDQALARLGQERGRFEVWEDRRLDVLAEWPIALAERLQALAQTDTPTP
jgi:hypothetical protein